MISQNILSEIELIFFDFDGVFTDNTVSITQDNVESVKCWRGDGIGIERLVKSGVKIHILSSETNPVVTLRAKKLGIDCSQGLENKAHALLNICNKYSIDPKKTMFVGNDINDISAFQEVGIAVGVADAHEEIFPHIDFKTKKNGGMGAVREICDIIFNAKIN